LVLVTQKLDSLLILLHHNVVGLDTVAVQIDILEDVCYNILLGLFGSGLWCSLDGEMSSVDSIFLKSNEYLACPHYSPFQLSHVHYSPFQHWTIYVSRISCCIRMI
jgi:hypothetical protein